MGKRAVDVESVVVTITVPKEWEEFVNAKAKEWGESKSVIWRKIIREGLRCLKEEKHGLR